LPWIIIQLHFAFSLLGGNQQSAEEPGKTGDQQFSG